MQNHNYFHRNSPLYFLLSYRWIKICGLRGKHLLSLLSFHSVFFRTKWKKYFVPKLVFLYSSGWEESFPTITQRRLSRILSDHFPILLECGQFSRGRHPFWFENMWLKAEGFMEQVKKWWESYQFYGTPSYILAHKLKALKLDLKRWNEEVFGNVSFKWKLLFDELTEVDVLAETRPLSAAEKIKGLHGTKVLVLSCVKFWYQSSLLHHFI